MNIVDLQSYTVHSLSPFLLCLTFFLLMVLDVVDFCQCFEIVNIIRQKMHIFSVFTWPYQFCSRYWIFLVVIKPGLHPVWNQVPQSRCSWPKVNIPILFFLQTASLCYWTLSERWYCTPSVYYLSNTVINYRVSVTLTINIQWHPNSCLFFIHSSYLCCQMTSWYFSWISYEKFNLRMSKNKILFFSCEFCYVLPVLKADVTLTLIHHK